MLVRLWERNRAILRSLVRTVLFDHSLIDDVLQEAFARLLKRNRTFPSERETYNYMRRVVLNTAIDFYRQRNRARLCAREFYSPADASTPLDLLIREEQENLHVSVLAEVLKALESLPLEQREAIELFFRRDGRRIKEICEKMKIPYSTLRSRMLAGIDAIRKELKEKGLYERVR